jgi:hypothetical protein
LKECAVREEGDRGLCWRIEKFRKEVDGHDDPTFQIVDEGKETSRGKAIFT